MTLIASDVIEDARDLHPAFDDNTHPDGVLLRALNRLQMQLMGRALERYPSLYSDTETIALPLTDFALGVSLTQPFFVDDLVGVRAGCTDTPIPIIPYEHRSDAQPHLFAYLVNRFLFLGRKASAWNGLDSLTIRYTTTLPQLATLEDELVIPDEARTALSLALAEVMAARGTQREDITPPDVSYFLGKAANAADLWLTNLWLLRSADSRFIRDVS